MTFKMNTIQDFGATREAQRCCQQISARVEGASLFAPAFAVSSSAPAMGSAAAL